MLTLLAPPGASIYLEKQNPCQKKSKYIPKTYKATFLLAVRAYYDSSRVEASGRLCCKLL